jgi:hypothetical protein
LLSFPLLCLSLLVISIVTPHQQQYSCRNQAIALKIS